MFISILLGTLFPYTASSDELILSNKVDFTDTIEFRTTVPARRVGRSNFVFDFEKFYQFVFPCPDDVEESLKEWSTLKVSLVLPCPSGWKPDGTLWSFNVDFCSFLIGSELGALGAETCRSVKAIVTDERIRRCSATDGIELEGPDFVEQMNTVTVIVSDTGQLVFEDASFTPSLKLSIETSKCLGSTVLTLCNLYYSNYFS